MELLEPPPPRGMALPGADDVDGDDGLRRGKHWSVPQRQRGREPTAAIQNAVTRLELLAAAAEGEGGRLDSMLLEAKETKAYLIIGFETWQSYIDALFEKSRQWAD